MSMSCLCNAMTTNFRVLCAQLLAAVEHQHGDPSIDRLALSRRARTALAEGDGVGPTDEELTDQEIEEWADAATEVPLEEMDPEVHGWRRCFSSHEFCETIRAAIARYGAIHPRPIPVAERMPTAADCDAEGRCWWWYAETMHFCGYWQWEADAPERAMDNQPAAWLPAAAIPLPEASP